MPRIGTAEAVRYIVMRGWSSRLYHAGPEVEKEVGVEGRRQNNYNNSCESGTFCFGPD